MSAGQRAVARRHAIHAAVCDRFEPWEHGTAVRATDIPTFHAYNCVRVERPVEGVEATELAAAADRLQHGLAHRQVEVEHAASGERLRPGFEALGWSTERLVWMELEGAPGRAPAAAVELAEVPFAATRPLRTAWFASGADAEDAATGFMAVAEDVAARRGTRALVARGRAGEPVAYAAFTVVAGEAEVEEVYVEPPRRGAGIGGALVHAAALAAATPRTWIVADDEDRPKRLYARLGFRPAWVQHAFSRRLR